MPENGKWQLGFWIMSAVCFGGLVFTGGHVIANENKRVEENVKIRDELDEKISIAMNRLESKIEDEVSKLEEKVEKIQVEQTAMKVQGAEILATLKQVYKEVKQ